MTVYQRETESEVRLRLSIWRPASLEGQYLYGPNEAIGLEHYSLLNKSALLEQIYTWDTGPYDVFGTCPQEVNERIRQDLVDPFGQHQPLHNRGIRCFQQTLHTILDDQDLRNATSWSDCPETLPDVDDLNLRANVTLGVLRHFLWVARVYADVPDASVLIR